jgi:methyltransferase (TIGR00027 family)
VRDRASLTAEFVCLLRALGGNDPFAETLLSPAFRALGAAWRAGRLAGLPVNALTLGIGPLIEARHRFIDRALLAALAGGAGQVVLLGAGLDARPWRFGAALQSARVFVVDHPATARLRAARTRSLPPVNATRVDVDFAREDFGDALLAAGHVPEIRSFFIWEGVSMYLPRRVVSACLDRIATLSVPGSGLALDLWRPDAGSPAVRAVEGLSRRALALSGEPVRFGLAPDAIAPFLAAHGFEAAEIERPRGVPWPGLTFVSAQKRALEPISAGA